MSRRDRHYQVYPRLLCLGKGVKSLRNGAWPTLTSRTQYSSAMGKPMECRRSPAKVRRAAWRWNAMRRRFPGCTRLECMAADSRVLLVRLHARHGSGAEGSPERCEKNLDYQNLLWTIDFCNDYAPCSISATAFLSMYSKSPLTCRLPQFSALPSLDAFPGR